MVAALSMNRPLALAIRREEDRPDIAQQGLEEECSVKGILLPEVEPLSRLQLNLRLECFKAALEIPLGSGGHGISRSLPWSISLSTLASRRSNLPAASSCCICLSQVSSSRSCTQRANSAHSSSVNCAMAALISATVLMRSNVPRSAACGKPAVTAGTGAWTAIQGPARDDLDS